MPKEHLVLWGLLLTNVDCMWVNIMHVKYFEKIMLNIILLKGIEGAAANAQVKQLEQQNSRLKEAIMRYCTLFDILIKYMLCGS